MQDIVDLEQRLAAALARIGDGLDLLPQRMAARVKEAVEAAKPQAPEPQATPTAETSPLAETHQAVIYRLRDRLAAAREREDQTRAEYEQRVAALSQQLDVHGLELERMRRATANLREELRALREAQAAGIADPELINQAMLAELEALRAERLAEIAELDTLNAALQSHLSEAQKTEDGAQDA